MVKYFYIMFQEWLSDNEASDVLSEKQQRENNDHSLFENNSIFAFFSDEVSFA